MATPAQLYSWAAVSLVISAMLLFALVCAMMAEGVQQQLCFFIPFVGATVSVARARFALGQDYSLILSLGFLVSWLAFHISDGLVDWQSALAYVEFAVAVSTATCAWGNRAGPQDQDEKKMPLIGAMGPASGRLDDFDPREAVADVQVTDLEADFGGIDEEAHESIPVGEQEEEEFITLAELAMMRNTSGDLPPMMSPQGDEHDDSDSDNNSDCSDDFDEKRSYAALSLASVCRAQPHLEIQEVTQEAFRKAVVKEMPSEILGAVEAVVDGMMKVQGGCVVAIAPKEAFYSLRNTVGVDYQAVDQGYMTNRLAGTTVKDSAFMEAMDEFSMHTESDRWPSWHEAGGKPKDGFFALLDTDGECVKCAVKLLGIPPAPIRWDFVGTRHSTSMNLVWALRDTSSAVVVRSDSGSVHVLFPSEGRVKAIKTWV